MVLVYDGMYRDPRVRRLSAAESVAWITALGAANRLGRETLALDEVDEALGPRREHGFEYDTTRIVDAFVNAELAERLPGGHVRLLARLDLWAFDDDDVHW